MIDWSQVLYAVLLSLFWLCVGALATSLWDRPRAYRLGFDKGHDAGFALGYASVREDAVEFYNMGARAALRTTRDDYEAGVRAGLRQAEEQARLKTTPKRRKRDAK